MAGHEYIINTEYGPGITSTPKYGENGGALYENPTSFTIEADGTASTDVWLKHGEQVYVENFPQTGVIEIVESANTGYTVTTNYNDGSDHPGSGNTVTATMPSGNLSVTYKNNRASTVPTGINLQKAAPVAGIVLAVALASVLLIGRKRREEV